MILDTAKAKRLWSYLKPYWHLEIVTFLIMAVIATLAIALPAALQYLIDSLIPSLTAANEAGRSVSLLPVFYFGLFLVGIYLGQGLFSWLRDYLAAHIGANIIANMRSDLFEHLE